MRAHFPAVRTREDFEVQQSIDVKQNKRIGTTRMD